MKPARDFPPGPRVFSIPHFFLFHLNGGKIVL